MKISQEVGQGFYREYLRKRDNTKGRLTEVEFMSWLYTTQTIIDEVHLEGRSVGRYHIDQYQLLSTFMELITPREIRIAKSVMYLNMKDNSYPEGAKSIEDSEYAVDPDEKTLVQLIEEWEEKCDRITKKNEAKKDAKKKWDEKELEANLPPAPKSQPVRLLSPSEYKDVQETMLRQVSSLTGSFQNIDVSEEKQFVTFDTSMVNYSVAGKTLTEELDGFRPIAIKSEVCQMVNLSQFCGTAESNFINWFKNKLTKTSSN